MKNRKPAIIFLIILAVIALISGVYAIATNVSDKTNIGKTTHPDIFLHNPDFYSDIMNEPEYLALDRTIKYSDGALTWEIANDTHENPSDYCQIFLINYVKALVSGDGEALQSMYTSDVVKALNIPNKITEQRIYEAKFTELSRKELKDNGEYYLRYEIKAEYKIQKNDGMFRPDLPSNSYKAQILYIDAKRNGSVITSVVEYIPNVQ